MSFYSNLFSGQDGTSSFYFTANRIQYANRNALKLDNMSKLVKNITKNNVFHRDCECDFDRWLMVVTGETDFVNPSDWSIVMLNSSLCQVPLFAKGCFSRAEVQLSKYDMKMCSMIGELYISTSARHHSIRGLKSRVLKLIFLA